MTQVSVKPVGGARLARNVLWNLAGLLVPVGAALIAIPWLIHALGTARFGLLTLAWVVLGYFGLFDLGLGRALTQLVSVRIGTNRSDEIPAIVWTALLLMTALGLAGGVALYFLAGRSVVGALNVPKDLVAETLAALQIVALGVPVVVLTSGLRGVLEAYHRFDLVNVVRLFNGVFTFLGPLIVVQRGSNLVGAIAALLVVRLIAWLAYLIFCLHKVPRLRDGILLHYGKMPELLRFGGWMTVTNVVGPLMDYMDRFLIAALTSLTAVAYYATPFEVVTKLLLIAGAVVGVLYPVFAAAQAQQTDTCARLYKAGLKYSFLLVFPVVLVIVAFSPEGLQIWLGAEFSNNSTRVLQWLAFGVLVNSLAQVPYALIQGAGHPDQTAKLHIVELPLYLVGVWWAVGEYGIIGAAAAWTLRVVIDAFLLFTLARRIVPQALLITPSVLVTLVFSVTALVVVALPIAVTARLLIVSLSLPILVILAWTRVIGHDERRALLNSLRKGSVVP